MCAADDQSAAQALSELAQSVIRDDIGSDELLRYMDEQLRIHLVEPHALCRQAAATIARGYPGLSPCEVARCLLRAANVLRGAIDRETSPSAILPRRQSVDTSVTVAAAESSEPATSTIPEFVASLAFTTVGIVQLAIWLHLIRRNPIIGWDNWVLSVGLAAACLAAGIAFFGCAIWQLVRQHRAGTHTDPGQAPDAEHRPISGARVERFDSGRM